MFGKSLFTEVILRCIFICASFTGAQGQIPEYYYQVNLELRGKELQEELSWLVTTTHTRELLFNPEVWAALKMADLDPDDTTKVLLIYGHDDNDGLTINDRTRGVNDNCTQSDCSGLWNREHVVARSQTMPPMGTTGAGADVHNLRAVDSDLNNYRGNRKFAVGEGKNSYVLSSGEFFPGNEWKGDVARILMFMYLRYGARALPEYAATGNKNFDPEGVMLDLLLLWNAEDSVSAIEIKRNEVFEKIQGNRNPFIDNPYLATLIWGGPQAENKWDITSTDEANEVSIQVYPNPVGEVLFVKGLKDPAFYYEIYDMTGLRISSGKNDNPIIVSNYSPAVYILKLVEQNQAFLIKFIKF